METPRYTLHFSSIARRQVRTTRWLLIILKLLLVLLLIFTRIPGWWLLSLVLIVTTAIEYRTAVVLPSVSFTDRHVAFRHVITRKYSWPSIHHVVLKDGLLTIDFISNRLMQREITDDVDERAFNDWCADRLSVIKK